jgi:hypothetical protein
MADVVSAIECRNRAPESWRSAGWRCGNLGLFESAAGTVVRTCSGTCRDASRPVDPTKVLHTDSSTCWREARSELRDRRSAIGSATKGIARFRAVAPWNRAMPFLELVQVLVSGQKPKGAGTPACHSFRKIGRLTLSLFLNPFENIVVANRAVRKEAVHRILLLCENFEYRVQLSTVSSLVRTIRLR